MSQTSGLSISMLYGSVAIRIIYFKLSSLEIQKALAIKSLYHSDIVA